jgi:hypothetical protein
MVEVVDVGQFIRSVEATAAISVFASVLTEVRFETTAYGDGHRVVQLSTDELLTAADISRVAFVQVENNPDPPSIITRAPYEFVEKEGLRAVDPYIQVSGKGPLCAPIGFHGTACSVLPLPDQLHDCCKSPGRTSE